MVAVPVVRDRTPLVSPLVGEPRGQRNPLILLADDDQETVRDITRHANILGFGILEAASAEDAVLTLTGVACIEVVVASWTLSGGVDRVIRVAVNRVKPVSTVVMAQDEQELRLAVFCDAIRVLLKPIGFEEFHAAIVEATRPMTKN
jgi:DNA-binding response OmpR family regulator